MHCFQVEGKIHTSSIIGVQIFQQVTDTFISNIDLYGPWIMGVGFMISATCLPIPLTPMVIAAGAILQQYGLFEIDLILWGFVGVVIGTETMTSKTRHSMTSHISS